MDLNELDKKVKDYLKDDRIADALNLLLEFFKNQKWEDEFITLCGNFESIKADRANNLIDYEKYSLSLSQLRVNILTIFRSAIQSQPSQQQEEKKHSNTLTETIPVFFSIGTPHLDSQTEYINYLENYLLKYKIKLIKLDGDDWSDLDPLQPILKKMEGCYGCLALAMERSYVNVGKIKRDSEKEQQIKEQSYATPWSHIETTMAYVLRLPFLVLKQQEIKAEGMLDDTLFEYGIVPFDLANPGMVDKFPIRDFIRRWADDVKKFRLSKITGS